MEYKTTTTQITIHRKDENAVFGESAIRIKIEDEGAGGYLVIEQDESSIRVDPEELELIILEARKIMAQFEDEN